MRHKLEQEGTKEDERVSSALSDILSGARFGTVRVRVRTRLSSNTLVCFECGLPSYARPCKRGDFFCVAKERQKNSSESSSAIAAQNAGQKLLLNERAWLKLAAHHGRKQPEMTCLPIFSTMNPLDRQQCKPSGFKHPLESSQVMRPEPDPPALTKFSKPQPCSLLASVNLPESLLNHLAKADHHQKPWCSLAPLGCVLPVTLQWASPATQVSTDCCR